MWQQLKIITNVELQVVYSYPPVFGFMYININEAIIFRSVIKILQLGNGTSTLANSSPTKSLTSITSLPKMKEIPPGGGGKKETETTVGAPIATLESTCEDLQVEVKNGGDLMVVTAHALAEMTANSDAMTAEAVSPTTKTSTCMNEAASPACV